MAKRWYVVHTYSNFEKKVASTLRERAAASEFASQVVEVRVPVEEVVEVRQGKKKTSERKFFPGYVLLQVETGEGSGGISDELYHMVKSIPRVTGFLGVENKPTPISQSEFERIEKQVQEGIDRPKPAIIFEIGEQVRVSEGPFASFTGVVEDVDIERARLKVAVRVLGRLTPVNVEYSQVEKKL